MMIKQIVAIIAVAGGVVSAADSAPTSRPSKTESHMEVAPAAEPRPALKYVLMPPAAAQIEGNAAPVFFQAFLAIKLSADDQRRIDELLAAPPEKFDTAKAESIVDNTEGALKAAALASTRTSCHWGVPIREQGVEALMPHLQQCREIARLIALKARLQTLDHHFDDALRTLQIGFALVDDLKDDACLVQGLVALGIREMLLNRVAEIEQTPGAPNLYWALRELPEPAVDLKAMLGVEQWLVLALTPEFKDRDPADVSPDEFHIVFGRIRKTLHMMASDQGAPIDAWALAVDMFAAAPMARAFLLTRGFTPERLDRMNLEQLTGFYFLRDYQEEADEHFKWASVPYWQLPATAHAERGPWVVTRNPLRDLLPSIGRVQFNIARDSRRLAMLEVVEALRGYAAGHANQFPRSLDELTEMPVPIDPTTGTAFAYKVDADTVILRSSGAGAKPDEGYTLTIKMR